MFSQEKDNSHGQNYAKEGLQRVPIPTECSADETTYRNIFENAPIGIYQSSLDCLIVANPALVRMFGYTDAAEMLAIASTPAQYFASCDQRQAIVNEAITSKTYIQHEVEYRRKDGSHFIGRLRMRAVFDAAGGFRFLEGFVEDITGHKQRERQLLDATNYAQTLLASSPIGVITYQASGQTISANEAAARLVGTTVENLKKQNFRELDSWKKSNLLKRAELALATGEEQLFEDQTVTSYGIAAWYSIRLVPFLHEGNPHLLLLVEDISERKRKNAFLEALVNSSIDGIMVVDNEGKKVFQNQRMAELWQIPPSIVSDLDNQVQHQFAREQTKDPTGFEEKNRLLITSQEAFARDELELKNGTILERRTSLVEDQAGNNFGRVWWFRDITAGKRAEMQIQLQSRALAAAANGITITRRDGKIIWVNPSFTRLTGYSADEAIGTYPRVLKSGQHPPSFYAGLWATILTGNIWHGEIINKRKDGRLYTEEMTITPVPGADGQISHFVAIKQDITGRKQLEEQLRQTQKMDAIGQMAGGVAHDFNNIIAAVLMHLGLLQQAFELTPGIRENLKQMESEISRGANLTRQLLLFSRRQTPRFKDLEVNVLIKDLLKMLRRLLQENIEVDFQDSSGAAWVWADAGMMEQVVMNLCINARDAMPNGGKLTLSTTSVTFDGEQSRSHPDARPGCFVCLSVADTGCGMNDVVLERMFEPFFTTKELGKGTGMGLATVYGIVKQHEGWIEVESAVDRGSSFRIYLPAKAPSDAAVINDSDAGVIAGGSETILLVEDEFSVRRPVALCLRKLGYAVLEASNGAEALKIWGQQHQQIDLLLTDMVMPGLVSGLELAKQMKNEKAALRVIISSGYSPDLPLIPLAGLELAYFPKPYMLASLAKFIRDCLEKT